MLSNTTAHCNIYQSTMEPGVAIITCDEDWEKAVQHLWGVSLSDFEIFRTAYRRPNAGITADEIPARSRSGDIAYFSSPVDESAAA